jgi:hypothetical protein
MRPMEATVAALEPEMVPKTTHEATVTSPRPPRRPPKRAMHHRTSRSAIPPRPINSPANRKKGTASSVKESTLPNMTWGMMLVGTLATKTRVAMDAARKQT